MHKSLFWQHPTLPMRIEHYALDTQRLKYAPVAKELEHMIKTSSDGKSKTWGYFPELEPNDSDYPKTIDLIRAFQSEIIQHDRLLSSLPLQLAFVWRATAEPSSEFGGFHVDVNAGISHEWPADVTPDMQVFRMLFNLGDSPRRLEFYPFTLETLAAKGVIIPRDHYQMLQLPVYLKTESIDIPPVESSAVYGLRFISNRVPHVGKTDGSGHFLVSYGAYISPAQAEASWA